MDYTIFYVFLAIGIAFGVTYLVSYFRRKNVLKQEDLMFAISMLGLSLKIVSELRIDKEEEIKNLTNIIIDSLEYAISSFDTAQDVKNNAYKYALELCEVMGIELTDSRKDLLMELITIVFNDKYIQFIES